MIQPEHNYRVTQKTWTNLTKGVLRRQGRRKKHTTVTRGNIAIVRYYIHQHSKTILCMCGRARFSVCACVRVLSKLYPANLSSIFMTTALHVPAFWSDSLFIKSRTSAVWEIKPHKKSVLPKISQICGHFDLWRDISNIFLCDRTFFDVNYLKHFNSLNEASSSQNADAVLDHFNNNIT